MSDTQLITSYSQLSGLEYLTMIIAIFVNQGNVGKHVRKVYGIMCAKLTETANVTGVNVLKIYDGRFLL